MTEPKLITPLLAEHIMGDPISDRHGVRCCPAMHKGTAQKCMVKIISIPASQVQLDALILSGAYPTPEAANAYFRRLAEDTIAEAALLQKLSRLEGFSAYDAWQLEPMADGIGYDVYLLSEYGMTLERYLHRGSMTHLSAVNLGLDLCTALSVSRRNGWLYVDLKPENILITENRGYQICDLGFIRLSSLKFASLPDKYRSAYTAPEITDAFSALNTTMDIYAAGLVLYQVYNGGQLPESGAEIVPPVYADYEIAQIILKACASDPAERWQDPQEMGQALVAYMQRNGVNDVPIIPVPAAPVEETADAPDLPAESLPEELPEEPVPQDMPDEEETEAVEENDEIPPILSPVLEENAEVSEETDDGVEEADIEPEQFVIEGFDPDDTAPGDADVDAYPDAVVSDEVTAMLAQADELIAHKAPDPVVAPEPIDVPIPAPIVDEPEPEELPPEENAEPLPEPEPEPIPDAPEATDPVPARTKKKYGWLIGLLIVVLFLTATFAGGNYYYNNYYLQTIHDISLSGSQDQLTVFLDTEVDNSLLTVTCTDTYGNKLMQPVINNQATFTQLPSGTTYKISVVISGNHALIGDTTATYTTATQTTIVTFTAITGDSDGSVILNFSVQGPDSTQWLVKYAAEGEAAQTTACTGHMAILNGLTVGKTYTFRLISQDDLYITGTDTLKFTASPVIYAQNLTIRGFTGGVLYADWTFPADTTVDSWTVRCYNSNGVDLIFNTTEPSIAIEGLDIAQGYTLDVKANGMTVSRWTSISAGSITFKDILLDNSDPDKLVITWNYEGTVPEGGWNLVYTVDGSAPITVNCEKNTCSLENLIPGGFYSFHFNIPADTTVYGGTAEFTAGTADAFAGYDIILDYLLVRLCRTPDVENWTWKDVEDEAYTSDFLAGERASCVLRLTEEYVTSSDIIDVLFVIRDANGAVVSTGVTSQTWTSLWYKGYCELDLPTLPSAPGFYTVDIFFNGAYINQEPLTFTVT